MNETKNTECYASISGEETNSNITNFRGKNLNIFPSTLAFCWVMWQAGTDTAYLRRLKEGNQTEFNKRLNIVIAAVWGLFICILYDILWTHILLSNVLKLYAIFIDNCIIKAATIQFDMQLLHSGKMWQMVCFLPYRKLLSFSGPEEKVTIFTSILLKKVSCIFGKRKLIPRTKVIISQAISQVHFCSQELSHHVLQGQQWSC